MAIAVIGGLVFSLFLTFCFMPALYVALEGQLAPRQAPLMPLAEAREERDLAPLR